MKEDDFLCYNNKDKETFIKMYKYGQVFENCMLLLGIATCLYIVFNLISSV